MSGSYLSHLLENLLQVHQPWSREYLQAGVQPVLDPEGPESLQAEGWKMVMQPEAPAEVSCLQQTAANFLLKPRGHGREL